MEIVFRKTINLISLLAFLLFVTTGAAMAAATLSVSAASIAADGVTVTLTIAGATGALSPTTGVTGFLVSTTDPYVNTSATVSGNTVTLVLRQPVPSGQSPILLYAYGAAPAGNLTDSGGNTVTPTAQSIVNNSTQPWTKYAANNSAFLFSPGASSGQIGNGGKAQVDFQFTGTGIMMPLNSTGTTTLTVTVDGASTTVNVVGGGYFFYTLAVGLSEGAHRVTLAGTSVYTDSTNFLWVTGASPSLSAVTDLGSNLLTNNASTQSALRLVGGWTNLAPSNNYIVLSPHSDGVIELKTTPGTTAISLYAFLVGLPFRVSIDGGALGSIVTSPNTSAWGYWQVVSGLSPAIAHDILLVQPKAVSGGFPGAVWIAAVNLTGGGLNTTPAFSTPNQWLFVGDSITEGNQVDNSVVATGTGNSPLNFPSLTTHYFNVDLVNLGFAGAGIPFVQYSPLITTLPIAPKKVFVWLGTNNSITSGNVAAFQSNYTSLLSSLQTAYPSAKFYCFGLWTAFGATLGNPAIQSAFASLPVANQGFYFDPNSCGLISTDYSQGPHPNPNGAAKIASRLKLLLSSFTLRRFLLGRSGSRSPQ